MEYPVQSNSQLEELLHAERAVYMPAASYGKHKLRHSKSYSIFRALQAFRRYEFYSGQQEAKKGWFSRKYHALKLLLLDRKRNILCEKAGIELTLGRIGPCIRIWHAGVVIYGTVGEGCVFHGCNVIGNKRTGASDDVPRLGRHVDVGFGACVVGKVEIADNCVIGAGAVVTKSFLIPGTVIVGVPAREIGRLTEE